MKISIAYSLLAGLLAGLGLLSGCSEEVDEVRTPNLRPQVRVTGGPREGTRSHFRARVLWAGWDQDGRVERYEYVVDPPSQFTNEEISSPESAPGLNLRTLAGPEGNTDTLRVTKSVDGETFSFDYVQTVRTDRVFEFSTPSPDSVYDFAHLKPDITYSGVHRIHVRALDNEGAYSETDQLGFTSWSITPESWISKPNIRQTEVVLAGGKLFISWGGIDPDPPQKASGPAGFLYKLIPLKQAGPQYNIVANIDLNTLVYEDSEHAPWIYQSAETTFVNVFLEPEQYVFVVRAVDELGAVEPFVQFSRIDGPGNAFKILSGSGAGKPVLQINGAILGSYRFTGGVNLPSVEIPTGTEIFPRWGASAEAYGGTIEGYSWGVDIPDLEKEGPGSGWQPWSNFLTPRVPLRFDEPGIHVLYVRARDEFGNVTTGGVLLNVFEMTLDQEVLYIDDYLDSTYPLDRQHDPFWAGLFENSGRFAPNDLDPEHYWYETGGDLDRGYLTVAPPKLSQLGRYKLLVWSTHGAGFCAQTGLLLASTHTTALRSYMRAGGKLWVTGPMNTSSFRIAACEGGGFSPPPGLVAGSTGYPKSFEGGSFAWDIMKIRAVEIDNDKRDDWVNALEGVRPVDPEDPDAFPEMWGDPDKFFRGHWANNAITHTDAITRSAADSVIGFPGITDSLYSYVAAGPFRNRARHKSRLDKAVCATRWHDPDPARDQGRVMWFGFSLYHMKTDQAQQAFNRAIDWFREEEVPR